MLKLIKGDEAMANTERMITFERYEEHKGFYNCAEGEKALCNIMYSDFFEYPEEDDDFPYSSAHELLCGSCNHFAMSLSKIFNYNPYIIEGNNKRGFHVFCQIHKKGRWYYVDARGITSSFDEFMDVAKMFVTDEYTIRPVTSSDIEEWENYSDYNKEAYAFAEAVIKKYENCYVLD